jgi:CHAT domain-containing protein
MTSERVLEAINGRKYLHFATHGILDPRYPLFSGLVLADRIVTTLNIFSLNIQARLVVLSACNTAGGTEWDGSDIVGLSRAFMCAGAPLVLVTLWSVSDESTAQFMKYFYQALKEGKSESSALLEAQDRLREKYPDPFYWAPFVLIGAE